MSHRGERPFVCSQPECGLAFVTSTHLKRHLKVHEKPKPFEVSLIFLFFFFFFFSFFLALGPFVCLPFRLSLSVWCWILLLLKIVVVSVCSALNLVVGCHLRSTFSWRSTCPCTLAFTRSSARWLDVGPASRLQRTWSNMQWNTVVRRISLCSNQE